MKRSTFIAVATLVVSSFVASNAQACFYTPWLDPFAWFGFYGGHGYGGIGGCGNNCCAPAWRQPVYRPYAAPVMNYQPAPNCNCGAAPAPALTAVRVPVTTYQPVTQYVPRTSYQTQYRYAPAATAWNTPAYPAPQTAMPGYPTQSIAAAPYTATYGSAPLPQTTYSGPVAGQPWPQTPIYQQAPVYQQTPAYQPSPAPVFQPPIQAPSNIASPVPGDIMGDHEYPIQSAHPQPVPLPAAARPQIRRVSYGVTPRSARSYPSSVR